jgi:flavodoxin
MKDIHVIYASTSGNTERVVETIGDILKDKGVNVFYHRAEITDIEIVKVNNLFLFATSTWEHGELNPYFKKLFEAMKSMNMSGKYAGFVGCGDTRYEPVLFCEGMEILRRVFLENKGQEIYEVLKINGDPNNVLDGIGKWAEEFYMQLNGYMTHNT